MVTIRYLFAFVVLIHALIHLMGFAKAFQLARIENISSSISKPAGVAWLITTVLFMVALTGFYLDKPFWPVVALIASVASQIIIVTVWKDARWGTLANAMIMVVAIQAFANVQFQKMITDEIEGLLHHVDESTVTAHQQPETLPKPVYKWLKHSGALDNETVYCARIKQTGCMRTTPDGKWMNFTAEQYFDFQNPAFVWTTQVEMISLITLTGRDKFVNGEGEMLIKLLSLVAVADEGPHDKINSAAMLRFLGETSWFPSTALSPYITWQEMDSVSAKVTMKYKDITVQGTFFFTEEGDFSAFEAARYYGGSADSRLENWRIDVVDYKTFNGIRIPYKNRVTWKLEEGDFMWLELEITALEPNNPTRFE